jgi:hypothetical protein
MYAGSALTKAGFLIDTTLLKRWMLSAFLIIP